MSQVSTKSKLYKKMYELLYSRYGPQGWWPVIISDDGHTAEYHPGKYDYPETGRQRLEIALGSILTQNTNWRNAASSLHSLYALTGYDTRKILGLSEEQLENALRSSGYFRQKAKKLRILVQYFVDNGFLKSQKVPDRNGLLSLWGIGPETADSILLYAWKQPEFVVDAFTKRITSRCGMQINKAGYRELKSAFEENLPPDIQLYNEYHALLVKHAKTHCRKKPVCLNCPVGFCPGFKY